MKKNEKNSILLHIHFCEICISYNIAGIHTPDCRTFVTNSGEINPIYQ